MIATILLVFSQCLYSVVQEIRSAAAPNSIIIFVLKNERINHPGRDHKRRVISTDTNCCDNAVSSRLQGFIDELLKVKKLQYITRQETASLLKISLPTLAEWTKLGILKQIKIGNRVIYRSDIVETYNDDLQKGMRKKHRRY